MVNPKTPNKKRKSFASVGGSPGGQTPRGPKPDTPFKFQNKPKANTTPGKFVKNQQPNQNTPKAAANNQQSTGKKQKNKRLGEADPEGSPSNKLQKFEGIGGLTPSPTKKKDGGKKQNPKANNEGVEKKRKGNRFFRIKQKAESGDKSAALREVEQKLKKFQEQSQLTKTAKRKFKILMKLRNNLTGERMEIKLPTQTQKRRERKQNVAAKKVAASNENKQKETEEQDDEDSSSEEVEALTTVSILQKPELQLNEESDDDDEDDSGEEEEESDDEDGAEEEEEEGESSEDEQPSLVAQGGKKKGQEQKNNIKAKNLKLQAMRKQGQLAGAIKQGQKRSARRAKKVNGS